MWKIVYEDDDTEDVDTHELVKILKELTTQTKQTIGVGVSQADTKEADNQQPTTDINIEQENGTQLQPNDLNTDTPRRRRKNVDHTRRNRKKKLKTGRIILIS